MDRSEAVTTMWMITACAPGLFRRATKVILQHQTTEESDEIADDLHKMLEKYSAWRRKWEANLLSDDFPVADDASLAKAGPTIYPQYLAYWALANRFLLAVQPYRAREAEINAINAALRIIEFNEVRETDSVVDLCRTLSVSIAYSIKKTTLEWTMQQYNSRESDTIDPAVFLRWNTLLGRTV